jgi:hypothetical protein
MTQKHKVGIGLIGSGFMGESHALGFATARRVFDLPFDIDLAVLADATATLAARGARALGFCRSAGNWRDLLTDPEIDIIHMTTPNTLHHEMALAAIGAGKHVYCEIVACADKREGQGHGWRGRGGQANKPSWFQLPQEPDDCACQGDYLQRRDR